MITIKQFIKKLCLKIIFPGRDITLQEFFLKESYSFFKKTSLYNASVDTDDDIEKMQYTILRENHVIEKGMSMRNPRKGFGQEKVISLLHRLKKYYRSYGNKDLGFLQYPLSTIKNYIEYTENSGVQIDDIKSKFKEIVKLTRLEITSHAGIVKVYKNDLHNQCNADYESILKSRHSIRYYSEEPVSKEKIIKALQLAQCTPSACNRQGWKTHVFQGEESVRLMRWQGGCNGFEDELKNSILVTANLKAFLSYEVYQCYIDGGLYSMNLINALHSLGLGCIPLSCGFYENKLRGLKAFGIPEHEVPIVIVAFGNLKEDFNVAVSTRKDISLTNTFHN